METFLLDDWSMFAADQVCWDALIAALGPAASVDCYSSSRSLTVFLRRTFGLLIDLLRCLTFAGAAAGAGDFDWRM